ncbi:MAG: RNA polymerase recycling motor HelD [Bacillota bacterium]|nr:RNA polymerase recycling motor HelD [Bacillota bacterium]
MAVNETEMNFEKRKLDETRLWVDEQIAEKRQSDIEFQKKIAELKKQSKGRYSEELETTQKLYEITHKSLEEFNEAKQQPYFARIDFRERLRTDVESYYIGKFGLGDNQDEIVIDWRAPIADLYYSGTEGKVSYEAPLGFIDGELSLKRKFLIKAGDLINVFDEGINEIILKSGVEEKEGNALIDEFLKINLEQSTSSKLRDIVATIQKEQNDVIRADKNSPVIVQGSAGSGKTTIALHRLAYLLYKYKNTLKPSDVLVIAPNRVFLDYISEVLPSLGVESVRQKTFEEIALEVLQLKYKVYNKDKKLAKVLEESDNEKVKYITSSSKLKGSMLFKAIVDRYLRYLEIQDSMVDDIKVNGNVLFESKEIRRLFTKDMVHLPLDARKEEIKKYFNLKVQEKILDLVDRVNFTYEYAIARIKKTMEDSVERRKKLIEIYDERDNKKREIQILAREELDNYFDNWKHSNPRRLLEQLYCNEEIFKEVTAGKVPELLFNYLASEYKENEQNNIVDSDDLAIMLYLKFRIEGIPEKHKYKHIVVDEAQDYSLFQYVSIKMMAANDSCTIVGDLGQGIYYYKGIESWEKLIDSVFENNASYVPLTQSYRSTIEIIDFANKVLSKQKGSLKPALPVLRHGKAPQVISFVNNKEFAKSLDEIAVEVEEMKKKTVAVIGRTYDECKKIKEALNKYSSFKWQLIKDTDKTLNMDKIIIPSYMTKGLEFDCSVIYNCNEENYGDNELDKKILYVALTRALHFQYVFYNGNISPLISE